MLCRKASSLQSSSGSGELSEGMSDDIADDAGADSIMQPLYRLIFEVFELTGIFKWLPRTLVSLVQVTYGKSISRCLSSLSFVSVLVYFLLILVNFSFVARLCVDLFVFICVYFVCFCFILHSCCIIVSTVGWIWWNWSLILRTYLLQCFDTFGWVIWPIKKLSPIWPVTCFVVR